MDFCWLFQNPQYASATKGWISVKVVILNVSFCSFQKKNTTTIAVEVKKSQHKYVIGPKGNTLQEILERTGVSVEIPPLDSSSETVILRGEPDRLGQALTEVYAKVNKLVFLPPACFSTIITSLKLSFVLFSLSFNLGNVLKILLQKCYNFRCVTFTILFSTGQQLHCVLSLCSLLASSFHYWQERTESGKGHAANA